MRSGIIGRARALAVGLMVAGASAVALACGDSGTDSIATAPDPDEEVTGTLRVFAYEDSVVPELIDPVKEANPGLEIETATFQSNEEAAAKLSGGFEADVVEICLDEMKPLVDKQLMRPLDVDGLEHWDDLSYTDAEGITIDDEVFAVPLSAGLEGLVYNTEEVPDGIDELADLWDPQFEGRATLHSSYAMLPIAVAAMSLGIEDPMNMSDEDLERTKEYLIEHRDQFRTLWDSDSDLVNLFKSGEVDVASAGPMLAKRIRDAGVPAEWSPAEEGTLSWVCGFAITSKAENIPAAYELINFQSSPEAQAIRARTGYIVTNKGAIELAPDDYREISGVDYADDAVPETYPRNYVPGWTQAFKEFKSE